MIVLFLVFTIISISSTVSTDEAFSLRESDYDRDGILDEDDECPLKSETFNKFEDTDGCPDSVSEEVTQYQFPDSDGDGVEDRFDSCVNLPETLNDYLDTDGCPEIIPDKFNGETDSDSDTIPDSYDVCPLEKETFNDFKDGDGCPDSFTSSPEDSKDSSLAFTECGFGKALVVRLNSQNTECIILDTAKKWEKYGILEIISESTAKEEKLPVVPEVIEEFEKSEPEISLPDYPDQPEISPDLLTSDDVSSQIILDTDKTVIGQDISYPSDSPQITSKIVTIPVGAETGPHTHEYPLFAFVMEGEVTVDYGDEGIKTFVKGNSFVEAVNYTHNGKNNGDEPTEILVVLMGEN